MRAVHVVVRGMVQGVGFRVFARRRAVALGLAGTVRNLPDARCVEVIVQGPEPALSLYLNDLAHGPTGSHVEDVVVEDLPGTAPLSGFSILA